MKKKLLVALSFVAILAACADNDNFRIEGTIEGKPTMNIRVGYYADNVYNTLITASREGKFEFFGNSSHPTIVDIYDYDYRTIARVYVVNGQQIECHIDRNDPYAIKASGNKETEQWAAFLNTNADSLRSGGPAAANRLVENFVRKNPENVLSTILLLTCFDSSRDIALADSLLTMIAPQARPATLTDAYNFMLQRLVDAEAAKSVLPITYIDKRDSIRTFKPSASSLSLLALSNEASGRTDSLVPAFKRIMKEKGAKGRVEIMDFSMDVDTIVWRRSVRTDSASWTQGWAAGGVAAIGVGRLGVPSLPYFILCDSAGTQIYRGPSVKVAEDSLKKVLNTITSLQ